MTLESLCNLWTLLSLLTQQIKKNFTLSKRTQIYISFLKNYTYILYVSIGELKSWMMEPLKKLWSFDLVAWRGFLFSALILNFIFACQLFFLQPLVSTLGKNQIFMIIFVWFWFGVFRFFSCKFGLLRFVRFLIVTVDLGIFNFQDLCFMGKELVYIVEVLDFEQNLECILLLCMSLWIYLCLISTWEV